jgi:hypothetical protein
LVYKRRPVIQLIVKLIVFSIRHDNKKELYIDVDGKCEIQITVMFYKIFFVGEGGGIPHQYCKGHMAILQLYW